jgi:hypothetical protein
MDDPERPVTHETTVINTGERRGSGGSLIAIALLVVVGVLAFLYFGGYLQRSPTKTHGDKAGVNINVSPKINLPDVNIERPKSEPPAGNSAR